MDLLIYLIYSFYIFDILSIYLIHLIKFDIFCDIFDIFFDIHISENYDSLYTIYVANIEQQKYNIQYLKTFQYQTQTLIDVLKF